MAVFVVETERDRGVLEHIKKLKELNLGKEFEVSFFIHNVNYKVFDYEASYLTLVSVSISIPPVYYLGLVFLALAVLFRPFFFWISLPFFLFWFLNSGPWFYIVFNRSLRKAGYQGDIKNVTLSKALRGVILGSERRV